MERGEREEMNERVQERYNRYLCSNEQMPIPRDKDRTEGIARLHSVDALL